MKARDVKTIVVTGVATNVCVDSTLRDGFFEGFHVVVARDCVGSDDPGLHDATLQNVDRYFGYVTESATLIDLMGRSSPT